MVRVTFDFRQTFRTGYGRVVVVPTIEDAAAAIERLVGQTLSVEITDVRELTDGEYARWLDYHRRVTEWSERAKTATAYRGLL